VKRLRLLEMGSLVTATVLDEGVVARVAKAPPTSVERYLYGTMGYEYGDDSKKRAPVRLFGNDRAFPYQRERVAGGSGSSGL